jgi:hypothetical protein
LGHVVVGGRCVGRYAKVNWSLVFGVLSKPSGVAKIALRGAVWAIVKRSLDACEKDELLTCPTRDFASQLDKRHEVFVHRLHCISLFTAMLFYKHATAITYALYLLGTAALSNLGKLGVPRPLTGSHPAVAFQLAPGITGDPFGAPWNLALPSQPVLAPSTTSFSASGLLYRSGFKKPSAGFLDLSLASLSKATIPPNAGAEQEVPWYPFSEPLS